MAVVVRCPGCRGAAQVGPEAVGLLVVCPRCSDPFLAVEDAPPAAPARPAQDRSDRPSRADRTRRAEPVGPPDDGRRPRAEWPIAPAVEPDDHHPTAGGLPVSVLIGLALLPFVVPLLWVIGPLALGQHPALSVATPVALAVSASVLCLAVVFTIDWSPATRVKGVLMLVGLAYFAGLSLFFLKKEMVDRAKDVFGAGTELNEFHPRDGTYHVRLPGPGHRPPAPAERPLPGWNLVCYRATLPASGGGTVFVVGSGPDVPPDLRNGAAWDERVNRAVAEAAGGADPDGPQAVKHPCPGWEWKVQLADGRRTRIVRVHRADERVYYLSAEGDQLDEDADTVRGFFDSFHLVPKQP